MTKFLAEIDLEYSSPPSESEVNNTQLALSNAIADVVGQKWQRGRGPRWGVSVSVTEAGSKAAKPEPWVHVWKMEVKDHIVERNLAIPFEIVMQSKLREIYDSGGEVLHIVPIDGAVLIVSRIMLE